MVDMNLDPYYFSFLFLALYTIATTNGLPTIKDPFQGSLGLEHIDPTLPPVLRGQTPMCSVLLLHRDFDGALGSTLASANYTRPHECPSPWTRVVLELSVSASDAQEHRVAAVWIDGAEVLRSATPIPAAPGAAFWKIEKDVTRYTALLRGRRVAYMMLQSGTGVTFTGVYSANVSLHFYRHSVEPAEFGVSSHPIKRLYQEPADMILPICDRNGFFRRSGFWLKINGENHVVSSAVRIPRNAYRAVLEVFVSHHGDDEDWYINPFGGASSYLNRPGNHSTTGMNGGFRQVYATMDDMFVGGSIPFPVIYPGSISPSLWSPVASIGAFDMPSYDLDVTPFLGPLLDGQQHRFGLGVRDARPYWLVTANLHVWTDPRSDSCGGGIVQYSAPPLKILRDAKWKSAEGESDIDVEGVHKFVGWVSSSEGNMTTTVQMRAKFTSHVEVHSQGLAEEVVVMHKERVLVAVVRGHQTVHRIESLTEAPLEVRMGSSGAPVRGMFTRKARLFHQLQETVFSFEGKGTSMSRLSDRQDADASALMLDGVPVWESGSSRSQYRYSVDGGACYLRTVNAAGGLVMIDKSVSCESVSDI